MLCLVFSIIYYKTGLLRTALYSGSFKPVQMSFLETALLQPSNYSKETNVQNSTPGISSFQIKGNSSGGRLTNITNVGPGLLTNTVTFAENAVVERDTEKHILKPLHENDSVVERMSDEEECNKRKFIVFMCLKKQECKGWGDRQKGIISTFLLALLTNRSFVIMNNEPCELSNFLEPISYNWTNCFEYITTVPKSKTQTLEYYNWYDSFQKSIPQTNFDAVLTKQVTFIRTNQIWIRAILAHPKAKDNIPWALGKTDREINKLVLVRLFRPRDALEQEIKTYMDKVRESQQLVCSHIRIGRNPTIPHDTKRRDRTNVTSIFMFLKRFDIPSRYVIYVASDSQKVRKSVAGNFTSSFTVGLPIVHLSRYYGKSVHIACQGFHALLLEQYILSKCDILILTRSGFGKMAANMSEKFQELYIFDSSNQTVIKRPEISDQNAWYAW